MVLLPINNFISSSQQAESRSLSALENANVSSNDIATVSSNPSVHVELSSSKGAITAAVVSIPPIYSKPTVSLSNEIQLSPSRGSTSSEALAENAILSKTDVAKDESEEKDVVEAEKGKSTTDFQLTEDDLKIIEELKARDQEVRAHEQAHKSVGGQYTGAVSLSYQAGPDGKRYAVGGEVPIDVSPIPGDPQATITKMAVVSAAATAPVQPSSQDQLVAAQAARLISEAQAELAKNNSDEIRASNEKSIEDKTENETEAETQSGTSNANSAYSENSLEKFISISQVDIEDVNLIDNLA